jgi:hypothetical protein
MWPASSLRLFGLHSCLQERNGLFGPTGSRNSELFSSLLVVGDEKRFELIQERFTDIVDGIEIFVVIGMNGNAEKPVIRFFRAVLDLFRGDNANETNGDEATDMGRCVHEDEDVERIAIFAERRWDEPEIEREQEREIELREWIYREGRAALPIVNRTVILVDDGLATGATMLAAVRAATPSLGRRLAPFERRSRGSAC